MAVCCLTLTGSSFCQNATTNKSKPASTAKPALENTLLWEISGKGLQKPSYLFGTMHILCAEDAVLSESMKDIIKKCDQIYFELDMDNQMEMLGAIQYLRMNDGLKLSDLLTKEEYARVEVYFKDHNITIPLTMLNRFKPMFISSMLSEQTMACPQKDGMETQIMKESKQYDKEIRGLETIQYQASIFDSIPYDKQAKDLINYVDSFENYKDITLQMVEVYRAQDLKRMDSLVQKSDPGMESYMDLLLYRRNRQWVEHMPSIMDHRSILFAVGAGHLSGQEGVINLLRKAGYKVKPMKN